MAPTHFDLDDVFKTYILPWLDQAREAVMHNPRFTSLVLLLSSLVPLLPLNVVQAVCSLPKESVWALLTAAGVTAESGGGGGGGGGVRPGSIAALYQSVAGGSGGGGGSGSGNGSGGEGNGNGNGSGSGNNPGALLATSKLISTLRQTYGTITRERNPPIDEDSESEEDEEELGNRRRRKGKCCQCSMVKLCVQAWLFVSAVVVFVASLNEPVDVEPPKA